VLAEYSLFGVYFVGAFSLSAISEMEIEMDKKTDVMNFRVNRDDAMQIRKFAIRNGHTISELCRVAVFDAMQKANNKAGDKNGHGGKDAYCV